MARSTKGGTGPRPCTSTGNLISSVTDRLLTERDLTHWGGDKSDDGLRAHVAEAKSMLAYGPEALGRPPADLSDVLAELAVSGPAQCALRAISSVTGLPIADESTVLNASRVGAAFRSFFNAPEVTAIVVGGTSDESGADEGGGRYWRDVLRHSIDGNLQAVLDEHIHVVRDWLGYLRLDDNNRRAQAANDIATKRRGGLGAPHLIVSRGYPSPRPRRAAT